MTADPQRFNIRLNRALVTAGYAVAVLLVLVPLIETLITVWPVRPGDVAWRFGAAGLITRAMLTPLFGILLGTVLAVALAHRRILRSIALLCGLLALGLCVSSGLFALDTLELRATVRHDMKPGFDVAALQAFSKLLLFGVVASLFGLGGWSASRPAGVARDQSRPEARSLLVRPVKPAPDS